MESIYAWLTILKAGFEWPEISYLDSLQSLGFKKKQIICNANDPPSLEHHSNSELLMV